MLVQVALLVFALCGLLSLVVDVGFARLTQNQMQNAADAAALEGLRHRDVGVRTPAGAIVNDAFASDCIRRAAANRMVRRTFDEDLDVTTADSQYLLGAGPIIGLTEGTTTLHAGQTISVPEPRVYKPDPQLNQSNVVYGDMVSGRFCYTADPVPSEGGQYEVQDIVCTEEQRGSGSYARNDFNPNLTSPTAPAGLSECPAPDDSVPSPWPLGGGGSLSTVNDSAFLVRLRRSNEFENVGGQEASVASSGPSLPLTYGKGTTIHGDSPLGGYSIRRDGLTVRATAIASVQPALHVGLPQTNPVQPGVTQFALADTCVQSPNGAAVTITVSINPVTGLMTRTGAAAPACPVGAVVGRFVANAAAISTVGQAMPVAPAAIQCAAATSFTARYGPVFSVMQALPPVPRIIGFTRVNFTRVAVCPAPGQPFTATIARGVSLVAPSNATADVAGRLPLPITASSALVRELFDKNRVRPGRLNYAPVLVAALAR